MDSRYLVVLITVPSLEVGKKVARALVEPGLAACVNITGPIRSLYTWQGEIQDDEEFLLIVKTRAGLFEEGVVPAVKAIHPYDTPEIIALPIEMGAQSYLDWIGEVTHWSDPSLPKTFSG